MISVVPRDSNIVCLIRVIQIYIRNIKNYTSTSQRTFGKFIAVILRGVQEFINRVNKKIKFIYVDILKNEKDTLKFVILKNNLNYYNNQKIIVKRIANLFEKILLNQIILTISIPINLISLTSSITDNQF